MPRVLPQPHRVRTLTAGVVIVVVALAGCGDGDPDAEDLADELVAETGGALNAEQARCVADGLRTSFGDDDYAPVLAAAGDAEDALEPGRAADIRVQVIDIFSACDAVGAVVLDD